MIDTCATYATSHNLSFSINVNPKKSKTKCIAFSKTRKNLKHLTLNDKTLPWVDSVKHLGTTITDELADMSQDLLEKRAQYISKNNELIQELHYAHPSTKILVNHIYNTHFYGAPLWDLFSSSFQKLEKTWNVSHRLMLSLPRTTHRYFIEPLTGKSHINKSIWKRFMKFIKSISESRKMVLRNVLHLVKDDCRLTTGRNLRKIMLMSDQDVGSTQPYRTIPDNESWRISLVQEIIGIKSGNLKVANFTFKELDIITEFACCT